jgi:hypothetical protein
VNKQIPTHRSFHFGAATATMAPPKKGWQTKEQREAAGFSGIQSFPINKRGRPRKRKKGNLASDEVIIAKTPPSNTKPMKRPAGEVMTANWVNPKKKKTTVATRTNWGKGEPLERITKAVNEWNDKTGQYWDSNGEARLLRAFSSVVNIPYDTFKKYVPSSGATSKRELGKSAGRPSLMNPDDQRFVADIVTRHDHGNDGKSTSKVIDVVMMMNPSLKQKQASNCFNCTIRTNNKDLLTQMDVKAQATTIKQLVISHSSTAVLLVQDI